MGVFIIIFIYLIAAIGHSKNKEGIDFNDLDKIPIEIILAVGVTIVICILGLVVTNIDRINLEYYKISNSLILTGYFISYILTAVMLVTIIKRIKANKKQNFFIFHPFVCRISSWSIIYASPKIFSNAFCTFAGQLHTVKQTKLPIREVLYTFEGLFC